jgi:hypothetical protein
MQPPCKLTLLDNDELVQLEYEEIKETIKMEKQFERQAWSTLWSTKGNRHRLIILITAGLFSQWSGNGQCTRTLPNNTNVDKVWFPTT